MQLHHLTSPSYRNKKTRVGRGGKRGTTSGRGQKGQKSRSGHRIRPASRDLFLRIPKRRGFRNKEKSDQPFELQVAELALKLRPLADGKKNVAVDIALLKGLSLVPKRHAGAVKVIGNGAIGAAITLKGIKATKGARAAIEKAGGSIENSATSQ